MQYETGNSFRETAKEKRKVLIIGGLIIVAITLANFGLQYYGEQMDQSAQQETEQGNEQGSENSTENNQNENAGQVSTNGELPDGTTKLGNSPIEMAGLEMFEASGVIEQPTLGEALSTWAKEKNVDVDTFKVRYFGDIPSPTIGQTDMVFATNNSEHPYLKVGVLFDKEENKTKTAVQSVDKTEFSSALSQIHEASTLAVYDSQTNALLDKYTMAGFAMASVKEADMVDCLDEYLKTVGSSATVFTYKQCAGNTNDLTIWMETNDETHKYLMAIGSRTDWSFSAVEAIGSTKVVGEQ